MCEVAVVSHCVCTRTDGQVVVGKAKLTLACDSLLLLMAWFIICSNYLGSVSSLKLVTTPVSISNV